MNTNGFEIYGTVTTSFAVYEAEKSGLLAEILKWLPNPAPEKSAGNTAGSVALHFDDEEHEDVHFEGSAYAGLGDTLEEQLRKLWEAHPGQVTGEVFVISSDGRQDALKRITLGVQFLSETL